MSDIRCLLFAVLESYQIYLAIELCFVSASDDGDILMMLFIQLRVNSEEYKGYI